MKKPDTPCAGCGKLLYTSSWSLPAGQRTCHDCRRAQPRPAKGTCATCGGPLCGQAKIYCSRACANGRAGTRAGSRTARPCEICGIQFKPSGGAYRPGKVQRTCSRACGVELRRREETFKPRTRLLASRVYIRECAWCDKLFVGRTAKNKACSRACGRKYNWAKSNAARRVTEHTCPCGTTIQPTRHKCDACLRETKREHKRKERARKRESVASEPYTLAEIAARDRYRCGICIAEGRRRQARVAMTQAVPHPKAPTIDHIVPWSISKDDTRANVQLAHFICNSRKHVRGSQQLALIG